MPKIAGFDGENVEMGGGDGGRLSCGGPRSTKVRPGFSRSIALVKRKGQ